ncbi:MAG: malate synthase G, partial [Janthinobacterium lividum]
MIERNGLQVAEVLSTFIEKEALPGTGMDAKSFWEGFAALVHEFAPRNRALLETRERLQAALDNWHSMHPGPVAGKALGDYREFLEGIGYIVPPPQTVRATTSNVDSEIALQAGPQLVVPLSNPRYALNAANARWGSLYDALYGTDAITESEGCERTARFNPNRGARVVARARAFLDDATPLATGSHADATCYELNRDQLRIHLKNGEVSPLADATQFVGYQGDAAAPSAILLRHNGLHLEIQIDAN